MFSLSALLDGQILELGPNTLQPGNLDFLGHALGKLLLDAQLGRLLGPSHVLRLADRVPLTSSNGKDAVGGYESFAVRLRANHSCRKKKKKTKLLKGTLNT